MFVIVLYISFRRAEAFHFQTIITPPFQLFSSNAPDVLFVMGLKLYQFPNALLTVVLSCWTAAVKQDEGRYSDQCRREKDTHLHLRKKNTSLHVGYVVCNPLCCHKNILVSATMPYVLLLITRVGKRRWGG